MGIVLLILIDSIDSIHFFFVRYTAALMNCLCSARMAEDEGRARGRSADHRRRKSRQRAGHGRRPIVVREGDAGVNRQRDCGTFLLLFLCFIGLGWVGFCFFFFVECVVVSMYWYMQTRRYLIHAEEKGGGGGGDDNDDAGPLQVLLSSEYILLYIPSFFVFVLYHECTVAVTYY